MVKIIRSENLKIRGSKKPSSDKEEFEIVPPNDATNDYEVIPTQQVRQLDKNELQIHENYFLFGSRNVTDSDSDIEIVSKHSDQTKKTRELYSDILQRSSKNIVSDQEDSFDAWGIADLMDENKMDDDYAVDWSNENDDDDDDDDSSGIEVVDSHPNDSLEIIFSDEVNVKEGHVGQDNIKEELVRSFFSDEDDYGIKTLFESIEDDFYSQETKYISMRTFTLVFLFCVCVFGGTSAGCGLGSLFVSNDQKPTSATFLDDDPPMSPDIMSADHTKMDISQIWLSSNSKKEIKSLLRSFWMLQEENKRLQKTLEDYKERYHLQKQMNWYWRRQVKGNAQKENRKIQNGLMATETVQDVVESIIQDVVNFSSFKLEKDNETAFLADLQDKLERERGKMKYWKQRYSAAHQTPAHQTPAHQTPAMGASNSSHKNRNESEFTFSSCLKILSKVWPNFKITSGINNLTKPVEEMAGHVQTAWSKIKKRWQRNNDMITKRNVKRFRKMFSMGNIINSARSKTHAIHSKLDDDNDYCADEAFKQFQERWKEPSTVTFPKPQDSLKRSEKNGKVKRTSVTHTCDKNTFIEETDVGFIEEYSILHKNGDGANKCKVLENVGDYFLEEIDGKFKTIEKNPNQLEPKPTKQIDSNVNKRETDDLDLKDDVHSDVSDGQLWYQKKLNALEFSNDVKIWKIQGYFQTLISDLEDQLISLKEDSQRIQNVFKESEHTFLQRQKENKKEVENLKKIIRKKQDSLDDWKFKEKLQMKREIQHLKAKIQKFRHQSKENRFKAKKAMKTYIDSEYKKLKNNRRDLPDEKLVKKVSYYKTKSQILEEETKALESKYKVLQALYLNQDIIKTKPVAGREKEIQSTWPLPTVYCPDQKNCGVKQKGVFQKAESESPQQRLTIFEMARIYDHDHLDSFTPAPPKPLPPKRLQYPKQPKPSSPRVTVNKSLKPSPPLKLKQQQNTSGLLDEEDEIGFFSWYDYWGKNRETYNAYSESDVRRLLPLNWYLVWMKHREEVREMSDVNPNWYLNMMKNRERQRNEDIPITWYYKWMQGRRKGYDQ